MILKDMFAQQDKIKQKYTTTTTKTTQTNKQNPQRPS